MKKINVKESWLNTLTMGLLGAVLMYLYSRVGEFATILQILPFMVLYVNDGLKSTLVAMLITYVIGFFLVDIVSLVYLIVFLSTSSLFIGYSIKNKKKLSYILLNATYIKIACFLALALFSYYVLEVNFIEVMKEAYQKSIESVEASLAMNIDLSKAQIDGYMKTLRASVDVAVENIPAIVFIFSFIGVFINTILGLKMLKKSRGDIKYVTKLNLLGASPELKIASVSTTAIVFIIYLLGFEHIDTLISNVMMVLGFFYLVNGVLVADFIIEKNKRNWMRFIMPVLFIVLLQAYFAYVIIGFLDMIFNFRRRIILYENTIGK
ncbi:MAG: DUF2232 domain-containing protein [Tissierellia bacterium]|nr:DUF2232 domain-containing protein [Tissierellia bacterium]